MRKLRGAAMKRLFEVFAVFAVSLLGLAAAGGPAQAQEPGPNGQIAFVRGNPALGDSQTYTVNPDGSHDRLLYPGVGEVPRWSPDGSKIAEPGNPTIYNADRSVFTTLPYPLPGFDPDTIFGCNVWSPDGTRLACEVLNDQHPERNGLYTFHFPDASDLVRVTTAPVDDIPADYSPGGSRIAFVRDNPARPALCQPCPLRGPHRWNRAAQAYRLGDLTRERGQLVSGWQVDRLRREWADLCHPPRRQRAPADPHRHRWQPLLRQGPSLVTQREQDRARPVPPAKRGARHLHDECGRHGPHSGHRLADL